AGRGADRRGVESRARRKLRVGARDARAHLRRRVDLARAVARDLAARPPDGAGGPDAPDAEGEVGRGRIALPRLRRIAHRGKPVGGRDLRQRQGRDLELSPGGDARPRRQSLLVSPRTGRDDAATAWKSSALDGLPGLPGRPVGAVTAKLLEL